MAYDYTAGEPYERNDGSIFQVPKDDDVADAPIAFQEFAESIPFSEYVNVDRINGGTRGTQKVAEEDNGKMLFITANTTLDFSEITSEGFTVAAVADADVTITFSGTNNDGAVGEYKVVTVVRVNGINILSVAEGSTTECPECSDCPDIPIAAEGAPPAPTALDGSAELVGGSVISFISGGEGDAGPTLAYGATIEPQDGATVTVDQDNLEVKVLDTTNSTNYVVSVYGVNVAGKGEEASTNAFQLNYNKASGGTPQTSNTDPKYPGADIFNNYNNRGERWAVHTFTGNGTLNVSADPNPFRVLVVNSGGNGGNGSTSTGGGGGNGGRVKTHENATISVDSHEVVGSASVAGYTASGGSYGGGGSGSSVGGAKGGDGGAGPYSDVAGVNKRYGGGGGGGCNDNCSGLGWGLGGAGGGGIGSGQHTVGNNGGPGSGTLGGGGGGGGSGGHSSCNGPGTGGPGGSGVVVVAYQIGESTTREIAQAQAEKEARAAGVEQGIEQGRLEGYEQAQEDLNDVIEAGRTALQPAVEQDTMLIDGKERPVKRRRSK